MRYVRFLLFVAALSLVFPTAPARGYVDLAPTLAKVIQDAQYVVVAEVEKYNRENGALILRKTRNLKGDDATTQFRHVVMAGQVTPRAVLDWAEPGAQAVLFVSPGSTTIVCMGRAWYEVAASGDGWWRLAPDRPDLPLAFCGRVSRLADAVGAMVAGKDAIITTLPHGLKGDGATFDVALNRASLPGAIMLQRMRVNLRMPTTVLSVSLNPAYVLGPGSVGEEEIPALLEKLRTADAATRAEIAEDLQTLGPAAAPARDALRALLSDAAPAPRLAAAAALLRIDAEDAAALAALRAGLDDASPAVRRVAARTAALAGDPAVAVLPRLITLLSDENELVRLSSLTAISTLGPKAAPAFDAVVKLLDERALALDAADALGRMRAAARPAMPKLVTLLNSPDILTRWAACRAMAQIGGPDSGPAVDFIMRQLADFTEWDGYNMMVYLCFLGQDAQKALPLLRTTMVKCRALRLYALWAMDPEHQFPWDDTDPMARPGGGGWLSEYPRLIYEGFIRELGDQLRPNAVVLANRILTGYTGDMPEWGYRLLALHPDAVLPVFTKALTSDNQVQRRRALLGLGKMGPAARPALPLIEALAAQDTDNKLMLTWCLKEVGGPVD